MSQDLLIDGLKKLRQPFAANHIGKLPKPTKAQTDAVKADLKKGVRCDLCGGWHHPQVVHLDYVGHAAITDRLLDVDPSWSWEPMALNSDGLPATDKVGGLWIKLTVLGVTRLGYGDAAGKSGGDAVKELIGDALRNAAMRFGCALDLWHKGDLHGDNIDDDANEDEKDDGLTNEQLSSLRNALEMAGMSEETFCAHNKIQINVLSDLPKERLAGAIKFLQGLAVPK